MNRRIVYLTGFMGSGKSTVGPILANTLGWDFYDLDRVIEGKEGMSVKEIFEKKGEAYFRDTERKTFLELSGGDKVIISLGGGTAASQENVDLLKKNGKLVYLKISPEAAYSRLRFKRDRPVLTVDGTVNLPKDEFIGKLKELMSKRENFYNQADITVQTDNISLGITIDRLARQITAEEN